MKRLGFGLLAVALAACGATTDASSSRGQRSSAPGDPTPLDRLDDSHWLWVETHCVDDSPPREPRHMELELHLRRVEDGLIWMADRERPQAGCASTTVWHANASIKHEDAWRLDPRAHVALPRESECGARPSVREAEIRASRRVLEVLERRAARCGGLDARSVFRRIREPSRSAEQVLRHYVAHYNRRDAEAVADLFSDHGSLVEPFSAVPRPTRHDGWSSVREWYAQALGSVPWLALRAVQLEKGAEPGHYTLVWEYMDAFLQQPFRGRNRFVLAAGEIFETQIQLLERPQPDSDVHPAS